ncbi:MAG TPA: Crp/Fnr family transcriptional regulator [Nevskiaceae bacterium]|nr:Crp/Fnr family transcriptional regulator [Nevskiaceae bacterium]
MLRDLVSRPQVLGDAQFSELADLVSERPCRRGDRLLEAGQQALITGVVVEGVLGEFYESPDGARKAKWLAGPGQVFGSLEDLVRVGPARAAIEALTNAVVLQLPYADLRALAVRDLAWARFFVSMMEDLYRRKSEREFTLLMLRAHERYAWFRRQYGPLEDQLAQEVIASYLGVTPVHLSRVRKAASSGARGR